LHVRVDVSQKRPALHSSFDVQPTLQLFVARSQYDSVGHGHVFGRALQLPSVEHTSPAPHPPPQSAGLAS
jgi:hypothetical protein